MERLTYFENGHWRLDFNGCQYRADFVDRLAAYEDVGLEPEQCENAKTIIEIAFSDDTSKAERIRELLKADKEGRLAVLPCKVGGSMLNAIDIERPEIMKGLHFAVAYESVGGIIFHLPYDIFRENIDAGHVQPLSKDAENALKEAQNGNKTDL